MKTIKFFILAFSLFVGTNLSANCFEMKVVPYEKTPAGYECYKITVTFLAAMGPGEAVMVSDGLNNNLKLSNTTTFIKYYPITSAPYTVTITCDTINSPACDQHDGCIVIVDGVTGP